MPVNNVQTPIILRISVNATDVGLRSAYVTIHHFSQPEIRICLPKMSENASPQANHACLPDGAQSSIIISASEETQLFPPLPSALSLGSAFLPFHRPSLTLSLSLSLSKSPSNYSPRHVTFSRRCLTPSPPRPSVRFWGKSNGRLGRVGP